MILNQMDDLVIVFLLFEANEDYDHCHLDQVSSSFQKSLPSNKAVTESFGRVGFGAVGASVGLDVGIGAGDGVWVWVVLLVSKMGFLLVIS